MDPWFERFLAKSTTITLYHDVDAPSAGFTTTTVPETKEELGPGWAIDDVYPPLAELRRALLTDEEWAAMSSWEKDVWEMYYRPDWERLACIEQILVDTPAAQRAQRHEEILEALRSLGASTSVSVDHLNASHAVPVDTASSAIVEEGPEDVTSASTGFITTVAATCSTVCLTRHPVAVPVLVASSPPTPTEYGLNINNIPVTALPLSMPCEFPTVFAPTVQMQQLYSGRKFVMPTSDQRIASNEARPMPWPSFMGVHADGDEARPLPWPSFREIHGCEFPDHAIEKASWLCNSDSPYAEVCAVIEFQISNSCGNLFTSTGYMITQDLCNSCEWRCLDDVLLFFEYCGSASDCVQSTHTYHTTLSWLPYTFSGFHLLVIVRSLELNSVKSSIVSSLIAVLWDERVLQAWDSGLQADFLYVQFTCLDQHTSCFPGNFITGGQIQDFVACSTLHMFLSGFLVSFRSVVMLDLQMARGGCPGVYLHKLQMDTSLMEGASLNNIHISVNLSHSVDMAVYCSSFSCTTGGAICKHILASTTFRNVGTLCWPGNFYSKATYDTYLKKPMHENLNISESNGSVSLGVLVHCSIGAAYLCWISDQENKISYVGVVLPDGQRSRNWHSTQTTYGQDAPLFTIPSVVLIYMVYCWVPAAILTDIVSIFSMHSQRLFFGVMNMSFAGNKLTCFSNSETGSCLFYVRLEISCELLSASSEWMWFRVGFGFLLIWALAESAYALPLEVAYSECPNLNLALASDGMRWQIAWSGMSGGSSRGNIKIGGNDILFIRFRRGTSFFGLLLSAHNLFPDGTFEADRVSLGLRTASFSRREVFMRAGFSEQVHLSCKYYLNHAYQVYKVYSNFMYCHDDSNKTKEVHMPWDPAKSNFKHTTPEASAWGQAEFQGGRDVSTLSYQYRYVGHYMGLAHLQELQTTNTQERGTIGSSKLDHEPGTAAAAPSSPSGSCLLPLSCFSLLHNCACI